MNWLRNTRVGVRLGATVALTIVAMAAIGGSVIWSDHTRQTHINEAIALSAISEHVSELRYRNNDVQDLESLILNQAYAGEPDAGQEDSFFTGILLGDQKLVEDALGAIDRSALDGEQQAMLDDIETGWGTFWQQNDGYLEAIRSGDPKAASEALFGPLNKTWLAMVDSTESLNKSIGASRATANQKSDAAARTGKTVMIGVFVAALIVAIVVGLVVNRSITRPISRCVAALRRLSNGDLTTRIEDSSKDELGQLATAFDETTEALQGAMREIAESSTTLASASEEMTAISGQMSHSADVAAGQATQSAAAASQVAANVSTVAAATTQMEAAVREIAGSTNAAVTVAGDAVTAVESSSATVRKLSDSSEEITEVVALITNIARQTKLLALNAQIEAGNAGEAGRGFNVVATEVKDLAVQTEDAAADIAKRITAVQGDASAAADSIGAITPIVERINEYQLAIATAVEEQTSVTSEMGRNLTEASTGATEIAGGAEALAAAAEMTRQGTSETRTTTDELTRMATQLSVLVDRFTI